MAEGDAIAEGAFVAAGGSIMSHSLLAMANLDSRVQSRQKLCTSDMEGMAASVAHTVRQCGHETHDQC
jgi:hypothetical protein